MKKSVDLAWLYWASQTLEAAPPACVMFCWKMWKVKDCEVRVGVFVLECSGELK